MARAEAARNGPRPLRSLDFVVPVWRLLASAQFAMVLLTFLALAGLVAVSVPQIPEQMRGSPVAELAWTELQRDKFGPFTDTMRWLSLFSVVDSWWFITGLCLLAASVLAAMANRLPALWRAIAQPQERAPDAFFDRAANRAAFATADAANVEALLRTRRYRVERFADGATTYLFADRFAWAQIGSFLSHLAVLLLLAGGFITWTGSYTTALFIPEGATQPVFPVRHANQMQVKVVDAIGSFDKAGTPLDYRSKLVIYQDGHEVARGVATVNDPLTYNGYRFHQAAYFGEGAALRVRDVASGNTIFREVLALRDLWPAPSIAVRDAQGQVLLRDTIVPTEQLQGVQGVWGTPMTVPGTGQDFWVGVRQDQKEAWQLVVLGLNDDQANAVIPSGQSRQAGDLKFTFRSVEGLPFVAAPSDAAPAIPGDEKRAVVILSKTAEGTPYLTVRGAVASSALTLFPNEPVRVGNREYVFEGRREFAGIQVRKDPGSMFIWVGVGVLLAGLAITFYVPRMRLWLRIRGDEAVIAAQAERSGGFRSETRQLARALGVRLTSGEEESDA